MIKQPRADTNDSLTSPVLRGRPRSNSIEFSASSITSSSQSAFNPFMDISPEAAFIAASAATGIVSNSQAAFFRSLQNDEEISVGSPTIPVTPAALRLINQFLDFLLFSFLTKSKATSLKYLRPAVQETLRARLATEAMAGADQELESYLGGEIGNELEEPEQAVEDWDLQGTWRRTRRRCMVYSSLGDMEEDDEDEYPEYENPNYDPISTKIARVVSPPVAIWLTAVLEFIGEQCLHVAGHATITRYAATRLVPGSSDVAKVPSVEDMDVERVALNPSLGRLWRQWRKRTRSPGSISLSGRDSSSILSRLDRSASATSIRAMSMYGGPSMESLRDAVSPKPKSLADIAATEEQDEVAEVATKTEKLTLTNGEEEKAEVKEEEVFESEKPKDDEEKTEEPQFRLSRKRPLSVSLMTTFEELTLREFKKPRASSLPPPPKAGFFDREKEEEIEEVCSCEADCSAREAVLDAYVEEAVEEAEDSAKEETTRRREFSVIDSKAQVVPRSNDGSEEPESAEAKPIEEKAVKEIVEGKCSACGKPAKPVEAPVEEATAELKPEVPAEASEPQIGTAVTTDEPVISVASSARGSAEDLVERAPVEQKEQPLKISIPKIARPVEPPVEVYEQSNQIPRSFESDRLGGGMNGSLPSITETKEDSDSITEFETSPTSPESRRGKTRELFLDTDDEEEPETVVATRVTVRAVSRDVSRERSSGEGSGRSSPKSTVSDGKRLTPPLTINVTPTSPHAKRRSMSLGKNSLDTKRATAGPIAPIATSPQSYGTGAPVRPWTPSTPDHGRRSLSFSGKSQQRPVTSGSIGSNGSGSVKVKTFMTWPSENGKPRASDDSSSHSSYGRTIDDKEKSFEELIQSGGTIHCTITPDPIRNMDSDSTHEYSLRKTSISGMSDGQRPSTTRSTATHRTTGATSIKIPASAARDARVTDSSTQSLALFLQSTGPPDSITSPKSAASKTSMNSLNSMKAKSLVSPVDAARSPITAPTESKVRLLPREASGSSTGESTAYLADFFRNTNPPKVEGAEATQKRISKSVAPFRNTMDSVQFDMAGNSSTTLTAAPNGDRSVKHLSSVDNFGAPESYQSSMNSTSGLIKNGAPPPRRDDNPMMPQRKQVRARDPYAIDFSDEEDDFDDMDIGVLPPPPRANKAREEESLIDFLRNNPPPTPSSPITPVTPNSDRSVVKKSSMGIMSRLSRTTSRKNSIASPSTTAAPLLPEIVPKHIPLITDTASFKYGASEYPGINNFATPPQTPHTPQTPRTPGSSMGASMSASMSSGRLPRRATMNAEPRDAKVHRNDIDSLADFLRNTGPPPPPPTRAPEPPVLKTEKSFSKLRGMGMLRKKRNVSGVA